LRPGERALAEGHDVDVVVEEYRNLQVLLNPAGNVEPVPAGHDRGVDRLPAGVMHGTGKPDADGDEIPMVTVDGGKQLPARLNHPAEHPFRAISDIDSLAGLAQAGSGQIGDGQRGVGGTEVRGEHEASGRVESELR